MIKRYEKIFVNLRTLAEESGMDEKVFPGILSSEEMSTFIQGEYLAYSKTFEEMDYFMRALENCDRFRISVAGGKEVRLTFAVKP